MDLRVRGERRGVVGTNNAATDTDATARAGTSGAAHGGMIGGIPASAASRAPRIFVSIPPNFSVLLAVTSCSISSYWVVTATIRSAVGSSRGLSV